jgi:hypothetical protein
MTMHTTVEKFPRASVPIHAGGYIRPAVVMAAISGGRYLVRLSLDDHSYSLPVRLAAYCQRPLAPGAEVVVAGENLDSGYIIGILENPDAREPAGKQVTSPAGASARVVSTRGRDRIQVRDAARRLIFDYDPVAGKSSLSAPRGDLELLAPDGDIRLRAGKRIHIQGDDHLDLTGANTVSLSTSSKAGDQPAHLRLDRTGTTLTGRRLGITVETGDLNIATTTFHGRKLTAAWESAKLVLGKLETVAVRLLERTKDSYRIVENLSEVKAGRMRHLVRNAFHLQSRNASVLAQEDVRIDGNRINLG